MKSAFLSLFGLLILTFSAVAEELPSCRDQWSRTGTPYIFKFDKNYEEFQAPLERKKCKKTWTVLVAMDANNDLAPFALWDLYEMESAYKNIEAGSTLRKDIVVQHAGTTLNRFHVFQSDREYKTMVREDFEEQTLSDVKSPIAQTLPLKETKKEAFVDFIQWGMKNYPADNYMVIYWGHGFGWSLDEEEAHLNGLDLREALKEIHEKTGEKIHNFVADACYMQGIEMSNELREYTDFITGSAQVQSFLGLPYRTLFYQIENSFGIFKNESYKDLVSVGENDSESTKAAKLVPLIAKITWGANGFGRRIDRESDGEFPDWKAFTYSTIETKKLVDVEAAFEALGSAILDYVTESPESEYERAKEISELWRLVQPYRSGVKTKEVGEALFKLSELKVESIASTAKDTIQALDEALLIHFDGELYEGRKGFRSMALWLPRNQDKYEQDLEIIKELNSSVFGYDEEKPSAWHRMLKTLMEVLEQ